MSNELDDLDALLSLMEEDDETEQKSKEQITTFQSESHFTSLSNINQIKPKKNNIISSGDSLYVCNRCKIRINPDTRTMSYDTLNLRLRHWTFVNLCNLPLKLKSKCVVNKEFVIIGILASKSIKISKNNNKYLLIKINDFRAEISCFIYNKEIIEKFCKIMEGTVLVLANPQISEYNDPITKKTNLSLKVNDSKHILIIGKSMDFGFCGKMQNNQIKCRNIVNKNTNDLCLKHKNENYKKYASKRNDTNRSSRPKLKTKNMKKLSGNRNVIMMQTNYNNKYNKNNKNNKKRSVAATNKALMHFTRTRRQSTGTRMFSQIKKTAKDEAIKKLLKGKTSMPYIGKDWNRNNQNHNINNNNNVVVLQPKNMNKNIKFNLAKPDDIQITLIKPKKNRKRSYNEMLIDDNTKENEPPTKKSRLSDNNDLPKNVIKENDLEEEEKAIINFLPISIYICRYSKCSLKDKSFEKPNEFCKSHQRHIIKKNGKKYFWKCDGCKFKYQTINKSKLLRKCNKCGCRNWSQASAFRG